VIELNYSDKGEKKFGTGKLTSNKSILFYARERHCSITRQVKGKETNSQV